MPLATVGSEVPLGWTVEREHGPPFAKIGICFAELAEP